MTVHLPAAERRAVDAGLAALRDERVVERLWALDHTLWSPYPPDVVDRLGWLTIAGEMRPHLAALRELAAELRAAGIDRALVIGMGGASLAAEMLARVFDAPGGAIAVEVVDTTEPTELQARIRATTFERTVLVLSMKRWALEADAIFKALFTELAGRLGRERAGRHVIALTDPDAWVVPFARKHGFRRILVNSPFVGGRYAALSYVGLLPAALLGLDLAVLLDRAEAAAERCAAAAEWLEPFGSLLGVVLGDLAAAGRDKLTFLAPPELAGWLGWVEQLVAESLGKGGRGILPILGETATAVGDYGPDRLFVRLRFGEGSAVGHAVMGAAADGAACPPAAAPGAVGVASRGPATAAPNLADPATADLVASGHPVVELHLRDRYDLGALCFLWEFAVAVAGQRMGVNPFDQPDVEAAKVRTAAVLHAPVAHATVLHAPGSQAPMPRAPMPRGPVPHVRVVHGRVPPATGSAAPGVHREEPEKGGSLPVTATGLGPADLARLLAFVAATPATGYLALLAFLPRNAEVARALDGVRALLGVGDAAEVGGGEAFGAPGGPTPTKRSRRRATTLGFGPRYLHSTGQLHKGDAGAGRFLVITTGASSDLPIPATLDDARPLYTFARLQAAQATGDAMALRDGGRHVLGIHLHGEPAAALAALTAQLRGYLDAA